MNLFLKVTSTKKLLDPSIIYIWIDFKRDLYRYSLEYTKLMVDAVLEAKKSGTSGIDKLQQLLSDHENTKYNELQVFTCSLQYSLIPL